MLHMPGHMIPRHARDALQQFHHHIGSMQHLNQKLRGPRSTQPHHGEMVKDPIHSIQTHPMPLNHHSPRCHRSHHPRTHPGRCRTVHDALFLAIDAQEVDLMRHDGLGQAPSTELR